MFSAIRDLRLTIAYCIHKIAECPRSFTCLGDVVLPLPHYAVANVQVTSDH